MAHAAVDVRALERDLEHGRVAPGDAIARLAIAAVDADTAGVRLDACRVLGALAGRAFDAPWEVAERAAFTLLGAAREADAPHERVGILHAMGRAFRNAWLMPYVHVRLGDQDEDVVDAAIGAAGGLAFPALEEAVARSFLDAESRRLRLAAVRALGRMGAEASAARLAPFVDGDADEALAALAALTEIRSRAGVRAALALVDRDPTPDVLVAAVRYLAEVGCDEVGPALRRLARDERAELRLEAGLASRALEGGRSRDAAEGILAALTEGDRAVRSSLARRLRTLPVGVVIEQAQLLVKDEPLGVVQIVAEVRAPEVTRFLLAIAGDETLPASVRARAAGSIEADEPWEREALFALLRTTTEPDVRVAAAQTVGAFASAEDVIENLAPLADDPSPAVRAALLWALQLAARSSGTGAAPRGRAEAIVRRALRDEDVSVRRRAAYVAGNWDREGALVGDLIELARTSTERADLRVAALVALAEIGAPARIADLVFLWNREDDPDVLGVASRAVERAITAHASASSTSSSSPSSAPSPSQPPGAPSSLGRAYDRVKRLLGAEDARVRAAACRVAGLAPGAVPIATLVALADDASARVREQAILAVGRCVVATPSLGDDATVRRAMRDALDDADSAVQERAAAALLTTREGAAVGAVIDLVSRMSDRSAAERIASHVALPLRELEVTLAALEPALARVAHDDAVYEALLALKVRALEATRPARTSSPPVSVDASIAASFPMWPRLSAVRSFEPLAKSVRTAEMLFATTAQQDPDGDLSPAIVLWMKCLEGYLHAWLGPKMRSLLQRPAVLREVTDCVLGSAWPSYQRYLAERWTDPVKVGTMSVEVPLRSVVNALRDLHDRRTNAFDSPVSVTEWSRLMLFFAVDHPSGARNVLAVTCADCDRAVRLAHRLQVLAQVRNAVTHRAPAGVATLTEFRRAYYAAFDELTSFA